MKVFVLLAAVYGTVFGLPQETNSGSMKGLAIYDDSQVYDNFTLFIKDLQEENYFETKGLKVKFSTGFAMATDHVNGYDPKYAFETQHRIPRFWHSLHLYGSKSLWYQFPEAYLVRAYTFRSRSWGAEALITSDGPSKYTFWGSNGDCRILENRKTLHNDPSGTKFGTKLIFKGVNINNVNKFICYGFTVTDVPGRLGRNGQPTGVKVVTISNVHFYNASDVCLDCSNADCKAANGCPGHCNHNALIGPKTCF